jgi:hypothetical protein
MYVLTNTLSQNYFSGCGNSMSDVGARWLDFTHFEGKGPAKPVPEPLGLKAKSAVKNGHFCGFTG